MRPSYIIFLPQATATPSSYIYSTSLSFHFQGLGGLHPRFFLEHGVGFGLGLQFL